MNPKAFSLSLMLLSLVQPVQAQILQDGNLCKIITFIPFTDLRESVPEAHADPGVDYYGYGSWPDAATLGKASFSLMAAAELARKHFNERDATIVPELAQLGDCSILLETEKSPGGETLYIDSAYSRSTSVEKLLDMTINAIEVGSSFCGVVGPIEPRANEGVSVLSESLQIPQVAYATIDRRLRRKDDFPTFARVIPVAADLGNAVAKYVQRVWERDYIAVIYDKSDYGEQFEDPLEGAQEMLGYKTITNHIIEGNDESIESALEEVSAKGYRTILLVTDREAILDDVARIAETKGLLGVGFFWVVSGGALPSALLPTLRYEVDSPVDKLLRGAAVFTNYDPFVYNGETDPFLKAWRRQNSTLVDRLNSIQPRQSNGGDFFTANPSYFQTETPTEYASFMYDAVMATGIGACNALRAGNSSNRGHYNKIVSSSFQGASGPVSFKRNEEENEFTNGRDPTGVLFGVHNMRPGIVNDDGLQSYELVLTSVYSQDNEYVNEISGKVEKGAWRDIEDTEFLFFDGTATAPLPKRTVADANYLSISVRIVGFCLVGLSLVFTLGTAAWVYFQRKSRLVTASQPEFLYLLCFGAALVATSLVFLSFDERQGLSNKKLSSMCSAFPWFFVIGYLVMYAALFSKLWRLSKLLSMRRRAIGVKQVLLPFYVIIAASLIVLVVWQVVHPYTWVRSEINDDPLETLGECQSRDRADDGLLPYIIPLLFLFFIITSMTAVVAWRMKDVQAELSESKWIFFGIIMHIQVWFVAVPVVIITKGVSRDAWYIIMASLTFIFPTSLVAFVIWPKVYVWARDKYFGGQPRQTVDLGAFTGQKETPVTGLGGSDDRSTAPFPANISTASPVPETSKIIEMESEITTLRQKLFESERKDDAVPACEIPEQAP